VDICKELTSCTSALALIIGRIVTAPSRQATATFSSYTTQRLVIPAAAHVPSMAAGATEEDPRTPPRDQSQLEKVASNGQDSVEEDSEEDDEEDDEEDSEPVLKYSRLTSNLSLYRNGDATSTFIVAGDKMVGP
jgi:hypothetical protein